MQEITREEKIDYIYTILKKQESRRTWSIISKWGFRIFILGYLYYFITIGLPSMIDNMIPDIPSGLNTENLNLYPNQIKNAIGEYFSK